MTTPILSGLHHRYAADMIFGKGTGRLVPREDSIDVVRRLPVVPENLDAVTDEPAVGDDVGGVDEEHHLIYEDHHDSTYCNNSG